MLVLRECRIGEYWKEVSKETEHHQGGEDSKDGGVDTANVTKGVAECVAMVWVDSTSQDPKGTARDTTATAQKEKENVAHPRQPGAL